jgi:hypothetical protein
MDYRRALRVVPSTVTDPERLTVRSLAPQIAMYLGTLARVPRAEVLLVSGDYGICEPAVSFAHGDRQAALAFFADALDPWWRYLTPEERRRLPFCDLGSQGLAAI